MQVTFRTNKKKISSGRLVRKNTKTVIVELESGKHIKRHIEKHYVRIAPADREEFEQLKSVRKPGSPQAKYFNNLMAGEQTLI